MRIPRLIVVILAALSVGVPRSFCADGISVAPYTDPTQLDVPWPKHSHYKQPWRGFLETRRGYDFVRGIGINYHVPSNDAVAVRLLAETGFKTFRIEIGFGHVNWDETAFSNELRLRTLLTLCRQYDIRPTLLLNAHQGVPCPVKFFRKQLVADAVKGSQSVTLADTDGLVVGRSGINGLTGYWAAEALITKIDEATGRCHLSKPLPKDLKAGGLPMATLKYPPLHPVGTDEFETTAGAWVRYALMVCRLAADAGIEDFDIEIWNELTFGTRFLNINNYYDHQAPQTPKGPDFLNRGGTCWELARRTVAAVKEQYPKTRCIWGFSNTTFYHCKIANLPPMIDGQSYHPYGTGTRRLPDREPHKDHPEWNIEGFTPTIDVRMPEGWGHTFIQTECLMRLLNPASREETRPEGTERFYHYITEHGVVPSECGVANEAAGWHLKTVCATRSFCLWLNKGVDVLHYFVAYNRDPLGMGLLPTELPKLAPDASFDSVATAPMKAVRNLTRAFAGSEPLGRTRPLAVEVAALGEQRTIFDGDGLHPPLCHRDVLAVLPFQITPNKLVVAVYVMTYDVTRPMQEEMYRLTLKGVRGTNARVTVYDPQQDKHTEASVLRRGDDSIELRLRVVDQPRLLTIEESRTHHQ